MMDYDLFKGEIKDYKFLLPGFSTIWWTFFKVVELYFSRSSFESPKFMVIFFKELNS